MAHAGGRPTKYKPEYIQLVDEYLKKTVDEVEVLEGGATRITVNLPMIEGFTDFLEVNRDTIDEWIRRYPQFSEAIDKIRREQLRRLTSHGLAGTYNSTIAKLILSANHGLRERSDLDLGAKDSYKDALSGAIDRANVTRQRRKK